MSAMSAAARAAVALGVALLVSTPSPPASALRVWENDDHTIDIDGALKSFFFGLHFHQQPPQLLALAGITENRGGMAIGDVRLKFEGNHVERYKWEMHFRSQATASSFPNALGSLGAGGFARPPRWLPLQTAAPFGANLQWIHELDRLNFRLRAGPVDLIVGRQAISFGVGFVWQPADLVATFSPIEVDREFKPGVDAIRANFAIGSLSELALVFSPGGPACIANRQPSGETCREVAPRFSIHHTVGVARLRTSVGSTDIGGIAGWVRGDFIVGTYVTAALGNFRLRSEVVLTHDFEEDLSYAGSGNPGGASSTYVRGVFGIDYRFDTKKPLFVLGEIYYNGFGSMDAADYGALSQRARVAEFAEVVNLGVLYAAVGLSWEPHPRLPVAVNILGNLLDPSAMVAATLTYKVADESLIVAGIYLPLGDPPRFGSSLPGFVATRSEFGLYPSLYFLSWKAYF